MWMIMFYLASLMRMMMKMMMMKMMSEEGPYSSHGLMISSSSTRVSALNGRIIRRGHTVHMV